ncbi:Eukaryotic translation initiation factor 3 subunit I [Stylophora pistillata]|uniref:Serine-threonine kinase receptor-associated protein n=1 Tax=Stylophora pistillata TaxID=50429 RepID=A0A2B4RXA4_STYPI|nr:Eukaryotic translation initiation factor 3 subunit I [Stylophora pistillata]
MKPLMLHGHERSITQIKYNRDGDLLFSSAKDTKPNVWYSLNGERLGTYNGHGGAVWCIDVDWETKHFISGSADNSLRFWDCETATTLSKYETKTAVRACGFSYCGQKVMMTTDRQMGHDCILMLYDIREGSRDPVLSVAVDGPKVTAALWGPLDQYIITGHENGDLCQWDTKFFLSVNEDIPALDPCQLPAYLLCSERALFISPPQVCQKLLKLNPSKATGPDNIPAHILREFAFKFADPVANLFNSSLAWGIVPDIWKDANITPVPKESVPRSLSDFWPISLTPCLSKVLEEFVACWVLEDIQSKIDPCQFGCLKGTSTTLCLMDMLHDWLSSLDTPGNTLCICMLDFIKAFDRINLNILMLKLINLGTGNKLLTVHEHTKQINDIQMYKDQTMFVTASKDHTAKLFDTDSLRHMNTYKTERPVNSASLSPIREHVVLGGGQEAMDVTTTSTRVGKFDARFFHTVFEEEIGRVKGHFGPINSTAFHPDGKRLKAFDLEAFKFPTFSIKQLGLMSRTRLSTEDPTIVVQTAKMTKEKPRFGAIPVVNMPRKSHESASSAPRPARSVVKEHDQQPKACYKSFGELCQRITCLKTLKVWKLKTMSDRLILKKIVEPFLLPEVEIMIDDSLAYTVKALVIPLCCSPAFSQKHFSM